MTILTNDKNFYDHEHKRVSRTIGNKVCKIDLTAQYNKAVKGDDTNLLDLLYRITHLDNESFKLMAQLQDNRARRATQ